MDGKEGASEDTVKPDGNITYVFEYLNDVIEFSIDYLMKRAPEKTGNYKKNYFLSVDGRQPLNVMSFVASNIPVTSEIILYNAVPYARKVDVQFVGKKKLNFVGHPANMFADCAQAVTSRFGNLVIAQRIRNVAFPDKYELQRVQMRPKPREHLVMRPKGTPAEHPGLAIKLRGV